MQCLELFRKRETTDNNPRQEALVESAVRKAHSLVESLTKIKNRGSCEMSSPSCTSKLLKGISSMSIIRDMRSSCMLRTGVTCRVDKLTMSIHIAIRCSENIKSEMAGIGVDAHDVLHTVDSRMKGRELNFFYYAEPSFKA
jgi:hypothetical protein